MSTIVLRVRHTPPLRVDLRDVLPLRLAALAADGIARLPVWHGNERLALADLFQIEVRGGDSAVLRFEGDCSRLDRIGAAMDGGRIEIDGSAGDYLGLQMTAGEIRCAGNAGMFAGCEMAGGRIRIDGDAGDFAGAALAGSMEGMRGGELVVRGNAGQRLGDRMRRGLLVVLGSAGDFAASRLVAGTIAIGGAIGVHPAYGMRRGTLVLARARPELGPTFLETAHDITVFWRLLASRLAKFGAPFDALARRVPRRRVGDLAAGGLGEVLDPG